MSDQNGPGRVAVSATANAAYEEACRTRPEPDRLVGYSSTDLPLPAALRVVDVASLTANAKARPHHSYDEVLQRRISVRSYAVLEVTDLVALLEKVFALRSYAAADDGGVRRFRPVPSAGARQPLVPLLLIHAVTGLQSGLWRYDPDGHRLLFLEDAEHEGQEIGDAWGTVCAAGAFEQRPPAVVVLAAKFDATLARYPAGSSLVWRDAGVALGYLHLTATSLQLSSCILGTAGVFSTRALAHCGLAGNLVGDVGALAVGAPLDVEAGARRT